MEQLNAYIHQARQQGQTDDQIWQTLLSAGWPLEQINAAFAGGPPVETQPLPAQPVLGQPKPFVPPNISNPVLDAPQIDTQSKSKLPLVLIGLVMVVLLVVSSALTLLNKKTSYQTVVQQFIVAMQKGDQKKADSMESPAAKVLLKNSLGTSSVYEACQRAGELCTSSFRQSYLNKATKTTKSYTAKDGTQGEAISYTAHQAINGTKAGGQACNSESTTTLTIAVIPKGRTWLIDNVDQKVDAKADLCAAPGATKSVST